MLNLTPYILLAPVVGFVALGLFGRALPRGLIALIGCGVVLVAFGLALADLVSMLSVASAERVSDTTLWTWISAGAFHVQFGLLSDSLSAVMLLVVTGVGLLIHIYSIGYMEDDPSFWRFFAFLNFFVFAMTLLVAADNFLFLLVGWAGVGLLPADRLLVHPSSGGGGGAQGVRRQRHRRLRTHDCHFPAGGRLRRAGLPHRTGHRAG